jgi:hypothetical protein
MSMDPELERLQKNLHAAVARARIVIDHARATRERRTSHLSFPTRSAPGQESQRDEVASERAP